METESGAKIAIRGKGSVKEGKGRSDAAHTSNQEEDLHCLIMADTEDKVNKAKKLIHNVIETVGFTYLETIRSRLTCQAASIPEGQNELKLGQLRELAALNGTLRDDENQACQNCGEIGHRKYQCPQQRNYTANIICRVCGNAGHMARDCPDRQRGANWRNDGPPIGGNGPAGRIGGGDAQDREYEALMQELSGGAPAGNGAPARIEGGAGGYENGGDSYQGGSGGAKPWERGPTGGPAPWQRGGDHGGRAGDDFNRGPTGGPAPWARGGQQNDGYGGGYGGAPGAGAGGPAPWAQQAPPPPPGGQNYGGYPAYGGFPSAPPGGVPPPPPGMHNYSNGGAPPPPPPAGGAPPPPPSDAPPPPPPGEAPPPPPPGA